MSNPFRSRKFLIAFLTILTPIIMAFTPDEVDAKIEKYAPAVAAVVIAAVTGITIEDSVRAWSERPATPRAAADDILDEVLPKPPVTNTVQNQGVG